MHYTGVPAIFVGRHGFHVAGGYIIITMTVNVDAVIDVFLV